MIVGYARTSTLEQVAGFEAQQRDLEAAGAEKVFQEQVSSVAARAQLDAALDFVREGDTFMVCKLDRLARSTQHLLAITERLKAKGVALRELNLGLDTSTPTGAMLLTMLGAIGQFEREIRRGSGRDWSAARNTPGERLPRPDGLNWLREVFYGPPSGGPFSCQCRRRPRGR